MARLGIGLLALAIAGAPLRADLAIRIRQTWGTGAPTTADYYYKQQLWRWGSPGGNYQIVDQAHKRSFLVTPASSEYTEFTQTRRPQETDDSETIVVEISTRDTGEQRPMFGHAARHLITTKRRRTEYRDQPPSASQEIVTDGWYLDLPDRVPSLSRTGAVAVLRLAGPGGSRSFPKVQVVRTGPTVKGIPVWEKTGGSLLEVTDLSEAPLDPKLFEVPEGFRRLVHPLPGEPLSWSDWLLFQWQEFQYWLSGFH